MTFGIIVSACIALKSQSPTGRPTNQPLYDIAFDQLVDELKTSLFHEQCGFFVTFGETDREKYLENSV